MPVPAVQKQLQHETLRGFLGVNLRRDRLSLADAELARVINADLHTKPGTILVRRGSSRQFPTALSSSEIRRLARHNGKRYQVAGGTLFRDQVSILAGLSSNNITTFMPFRPLGDTTNWVFFADDSVMQKDDGTNLRNWGIAGPEAAPTTAVGAAGSLTGVYISAYTYARLVSGTVVHESNPSSNGTARTLASETLDTTVVASSDAQVTNIHLYRTVAGGSSLLFDQRVNNTSATVNSSQADSALGSVVETDNNVPNNMSWITAFQNHMWGCRDAINQHYLWYSKRFQPEAFPSSQFLEIGSPDDPLQCLVPLTGLLGVFSRDTKYRVFGNITSGFAYLEAHSSRGTPAPNAVLKTSQGAIFPARDGIFLTNFVQQDTELSQTIEPIFHEETINDYLPVDWSRSLDMSMAEYKGRLYWGYVDTDGQRIMAVGSRDTRQWYFYDHPARSLLFEEDIDDLTMGSDDGFVYILEDVTATGDAGSAIPLTVEFPQRAAGDDGVMKVFHFLRVDIDAKGGSVQLSLKIDDTVRVNKTITGSRNRQLLRLPDRLMGFVWEITATYTGTEQAEIHSLRLSYMPLEAA